MTANSENNHCSPWSTYIVSWSLVNISSKSLSWSVHISTLGQTPKTYKHMGFSPTIVYHYPCFSHFPRLSPKKFPGQFPPNGPACRSAQLRRPLQESGSGLGRPVALGSIAMGPKTSKNGWFLLGNILWKRDENWGYPHLWKPYGRNVQECTIKLTRFTPCIYSMSLWMFMLQTWYFIGNWIHPSQFPLPSATDSTMVGNGTQKHGICPLVAIIYYLDPEEPVYLGCNRDKLGRYMEIWLYPRIWCLKPRDFGVAKFQSQMDPSSKNLTTIDNMFL